MATTSYFSDFDWAFIPHPKTGDIPILPDELAIKRSIKNIIYTKYSERRFYSDKGCGIHFYNFDQLDIFTARGIKSEIETAVKNIEPRVSIVDIRFLGNEEEHSLSVTIDYQIINSTKIDSTTIFLERAR